MPSPRLAISCLAQIRIACACSRKADSFLAIFTQDLFDKFRSAVELRSAFRDSFALEFGERASFQGQLPDFDSRHFRVYTPAYYGELSVHRWVKLQVQKAESEACRILERPLARDHRADHIHHQLIREWRKHLRNEQ